MSSKKSVKHRLQNLSSIAGALVLSFTDHDERLADDERRGGLPHHCMDDAHKNILKHWLWLADQIIEKGPSVAHDAKRIIQAELDRRTAT